jgi:hypothetical protein
MRDTSVLRPSVVLVAGIVFVLAPMLWWTVGQANVRIVLPNGYRGGFCIVYQDMSGDQSRQSRQHFVPSSGTLRLADRCPFNRPHHISAKYRNGRQLVSGRLGETGPNVVAIWGPSLAVPADVIISREDERGITRAIRSTVYRGGERITEAWFFVGTADEYLAWTKDPFSAPSVRN